MLIEKKSQNENGQRIYTKTVILFQTDEERERERENERKNPPFTTVPIFT